MLRTRARYGPGHRPARRDYPAQCDTRSPSVSVFAFLTKLLVDLVLDWGGYRPAGPVGGCLRGVERPGALSDSGIRGRPGLAHRAGGPAFDLVVSKLRRPPARPGAVLRSSLIDRLARDDLRPVASVVAPAGYGKTTLLSQWAERTGQTFAWVSVDERDNDPKVLLT